MGELQIRDRGLELGSGQRASHPSSKGGPGARVDVGRFERPAHQALKQEALLVGRLPADQRAHVAAVPPEAGRRLECSLPRDLAQLAAVAHQGASDALVGVDRLVGEATLVAQPAVVNFGMLSGLHPQHTLVANGELDVALGRAQGADATRALDVPRSGPEAVRVGRQGTHRAELHDVAREWRHVGVAVVGGYERVRAALGEDQLVVLGDLLGEAHAAVAENAALTVDGDQRAQRQWLLEMALGLDETRAAQSPTERDVLQRALPALVAYRAVERVVDEQELDHRVLGVPDAVGLGVDHHAVLDRGRAGCLELGDALDLDQAHAAGAHGLTELGLVAEERDLDVAPLGGVDQHHSFRRRHLAAVDRQLDGVQFGTGHSGPSVHR